MPAVEPAEQLLRSARGRIRCRPTRRRSSSITSSRRRSPSRSATSIQNGTDTQPLSLTGNIPWVDRDFKWTQHNVNVAAHLDAEPDDDQSAARHLRAAVRRPREQPDDVARRSELEVHDPGRSDAAAPHGHRLLHRPDVDRRARRRQQLLRREGRAEHHRGKHSFKFGGEVSYEEIVHDTLLDNYGVFAFNGSKTGNAYADFLLGLPATMTQDAPVRKTDNGAYISAVRAGRLPHPPARHAEPRPPLRPAVSVHRSAGPQAGLRAGRSSRRSTPTAPVGLLFPGDAGVSRGIVHTDYQQHRAAPRHRVGSDGRRPHAVRAAFGMFYGSITGNEWNTTADNQPFTVRQSFPTVFTLSDPYRNLPGGVGPFPFNYTPRVAALHAAGAGVRSVARFRLAAQLSDEHHGREGDRPQLQRDRARTSARSAGTCAAGVDSNYPVFGADARRPRTSTRGGRICPARSARRPCSSSIFSSDYNGLQLSAERRGTRLIGQGVLLVRPRLRGRRLPGRRPARRAERERGSAANAAGPPPIARTASCSRACGSSTTSRLVVGR